jgi:3-phosphoshikimate 1-carboxyvinyltransferase
VTGHDRWPRVATSGGAPRDTVSIVPGRPLTGRVRVPGDKSVSHRALLLAARGEGVSVLRGLSDGDDVRRTALAVAAAGALVEAQAGVRPGSRASPGSSATPIGDVEVTGGVARLHEPETPLDVGNSGTGMRLLAGWLAGFPWFAVLHGDEYLARRPMDRVAVPLRLMGAAVDGRDGGRFSPLAIRGGALTGIDYTLPVASAQVKGAVLLAGLGAEGPTTVRERAPVRAHTEELLAAAGARVELAAGGTVVTLHPGPLRPLDLTVPGDPSQAAFWVVAGCVVPGSDLTVEGVYVGRARAGFLDVLRRMGADIEISMLDATTADLHVRTSGLHGTEVAGDEVPGLIDEIPVLAVAAACAEGVTTFADASELAVKETDRIAATTATLRAFGGRAEARADGLVVVGGGSLQGADVDSGGDHRIAMAAAVAALAASEPSRVRGWGAVATSYPGFVDDLEELQR